MAKIDNGPGTYKGEIPKVNYGQVKTDPARIDYDAYSKPLIEEMKKRKQKEKEEQK